MTSFSTSAVILALEATFSIPFIQETIHVLSSWSSLSTPSINKGHNMFTGSDIPAPCGVAGEPTVDASGGEDVQGLFNMSLVT